MNVHFRELGYKEGTEIFILWCIPPDMPTSHCRHCRHMTSFKLAPIFHSGAIHKSHVRFVRHTTAIEEGYRRAGRWDFGVADLVNLWFGFPVFALKNCGFSVLVYLRCLRVFSNLVFAFLFLSTMMAVFGIFVQFILRFFWFSQRSYTQLQSP